MKWKYSSLGITFILIVIQLVGNPIVISPTTIRNETNLPEYVPILLQAPNPLWNRTFGGTQSDSGRSVVQCSDGGFAIGGNTRNFGADGYDAWLIRTDVNGYHLWNRTFGGSEYDYGTSVVQCSDGGFAIGGNTDSLGNADFWLIRTDTLGNPQWIQIYMHSGDDRSFSMVQCSDGGFALIGYTAIIGRGHEILLTRTDADGNLLWNHTYGGVDFDYGWSVVECSDGGFALACSTDSFGAGDDDAWLIRTDANGYHLWNNTYGGSNNDEARTIVKCSNGGFAIGGYTTSFGVDLSDAWFIRTDTMGIPLWNRTYGGIGNDDCQMLLECSVGGFALFGNTNSSGAGNRDFWLVRTDVFGNFLWDCTFGSVSNEYSYGIVECVGGGFSLVGVTYGFGAGDVWLFRTPDSFPSTPLLPIPGFPMIAIIIGVIIAIGLGMIRRRRQHRQSEKA